MIVTQSLNIRSEILDLMKLVHVTESGNISIPKEWRKELGISPKSKVVMEKRGSKLVISSLTQKSFSEAVDSVHNELRRKKIAFTREESIKDDLYD